MKYTDFTKRFPLTKTLRFELIPHGETEKKIKEAQADDEISPLQRDEQRAEKYEQAKKLIDIYHRFHIEQALAVVNFKDLQCDKELEIIKENIFKTDFASSEEKRNHQNTLDAAQKNLRAAIASVLTGTGTGTVQKKIIEELPAKKKAAIDELKKRYGLLTKKELFDPKKHSEFRSVVVASGLSEAEFDETISYFKGFSTYFKGFHENRKNMYSNEKQATAIANRIVHENLPRFLDNIQTFIKIENALKANDLKKIKSDLKLTQNLASYFTLSYFQKTLNQSGIDHYNQVLGGYFVQDTEKKVKGLNECINLYNQEHPDTRLPRLKPLYKQILSETDGKSFRPEPFETDQELLTALQEFWSQCIEKAINEEDHSRFNVLKIFQKATKQFKSMKKADRKGIFIDRKRLSTLSHQAFGRWDILSNALREKYLHDHIEESETKNEKGLAALFAKPFYSLDDLEEALAFYFDQVETDAKLRSHQSLKDFFQAGLFVEEEVVEKGSREQRSDTEDKEVIQEVEKDIVKTIQDAYQEVKALIQSEKQESEGLHKDKKKVETIKKFLDALKNLQWQLGNFHTEASSTDKNDSFYSLWDPCYEAIQPLNPLYNKVRNRLTRKPFSEEKLKLTFDHSRLLEGWVESDTDKSYNGTQYGGYLFRKKNEIGEYDYFLGISKSRNLFRKSEFDKNTKINEKGDYERLYYYQLHSKNFYRVFFGGSETSKVGYSALQDKAESFLRDFGKKENGEIGKMIENHFEKPDSTPSGCFRALKKDHPSAFQKVVKSKEFKEINENVKQGIFSGVKSLERIEGTDSFDRTAEFYWDMHENLESFLKKVKIYDYFSVPNSEIEQSLAEKSSKGLYLFKISNKDLAYSESKNYRGRKYRGRENLHTIYFKHLMSGNQAVYDIGTGDVFFRKASIPAKNQVVHEKNKAIDRRSSDQKSYFKYDIIKDRRYTKDKYLLHLSMELNYSEPDLKEANQFNSLVHAFVKKTKNIKAIGIDRGERHLLYLSLIDEKGKIIEQFSLNSIHNEKTKTDMDFREKLDAREKERQSARQNWDVIENIKEIKEGYLSLVVHKIATLMVENQAILIMEDLNAGFKRGRFKVEKQVYQKFEKMLIDKLNYLVFKDVDPEKPGGSLNALQLTSKFKSFQDLGKQSGMIFYVPAAYTSKIDPVTGFYNFLNPKAGTIAANQGFLQKFDSIRFNPEKKYFEFHATYGNFVKSANNATGGKKNSKTDPWVGELAEKKWTICSHEGERYRFRRSKNGSISYEAFNCNSEFKALLKKEGIAFENGEELKEKIGAVNNAAFLKSIIETLRILLAMRYNNGKKGEEEKDYILSPVADRKSGTFFNSLTAATSLPVDADANGAYHIAKKGLLLVNKIRSFDPGGKTKVPDLYISHNEWIHSLWH